MELNMDEISKQLYRNVVVTLRVDRTREYKSEFLSHVTTNNLAYSGYLKAFDPITKSVILCSIKDSKVDKNILIIGHNIESIRVSNEDLLPLNVVEQIIVDNRNEQLNKQADLFSKTDRLSAGQLEERRLEILSWLEQNRIPAVSEPSTNDIIIGDCVRIKSPYENAADYVCPTRVILKRIMKLLESRRKLQHDPISLVDFNIEPFE